MSYICSPTSGRELKSSNADKVNELSPPSKTQEPNLTRKQLTARALVVEKQANKRLDELSRDEFTQFCKAVDDDVYDAISIDAAIQAKNGVGGTSTAQVTHQIKRLMAE